MAHYSRARCPWFSCLVVALALAAALSGCTAGIGPLRPATVLPAPAPIITRATSSATTVAPAAANATPAVPATAKASPTPLAALPALPQAFRFEVLLRPANAPNGPDTEITGLYRAGAWQQSAHTRTASSDSQPPAQEMLVMGGATYTRPADVPTWTRWPGTSFDAGFGLTSPFTALRLFAVADQKVRGEAAAVPGVSEATYRTQVVISADTIRQVLQAGAALVAPDGETQRTLIEQVAPLTVAQTVTYWANDQGRVYRAAATLLTADKSGQGTPWMQITWRFWAYDDPALAVAAPASYRDAPGPAAQNQAQPTAGPARGLTTQTNLTVRVFAAPGVPADNLAVTIYPAGDTRQPIDWRNGAAAQFALPPGRYDALVQMDYAQEWLRGLEIKAGTPVTREVTFDFGTLKLTVLRGGQPVPVDVVTYPAGNRQNWVDWRSDNPAAIRLRAGVYDVEIAYDDYQGHQIVTGLQIQTGQTTSQTVTLGQ